MTTPEGRAALVSGRQPPSAAADEPLRPRRRLNELVLVPALIALLVVGAIVNPQFLTTGNIVNILGASAPVALLVVAQTLIVLAGSFDLSHESTAAFAPAIGT